jgi:hypothetical protein
MKGAQPRGVAHAQARRRAPPGSKTLVSYSNAFVTHTGPSVHSSSPHYVASYAPPNERSTLEEAMASPFATQRTAAILQDLGSIDKHGTYAVVPRPRNRKVVGSRFEFKIKDAETLDPRFKARFVAKGFTQVPHVDFEESFRQFQINIRSSSPRSCSREPSPYQPFRRRNGVPEHRYRSNNLHSNNPSALNTQIYPRKDFVLLVNKGLYGLKQSGSLYAEDQKQKLMALGFVPSEADECVFISADKKIIVATYVDDGLVLAETQHELAYKNSTIIRHEFIDGHCKRKAAKATY